MVSIKMQIELGIELTDETDRRLDQGVGSQGNLGSDANLSRRENSLKTYNLKYCYLINKNRN